MNTAKQNAPQRVSGNTSALLARFKKQLCVVGLGLGMVVSTGCGMPPLDDQQNPIMDQSDAPRLPQAGEVTTKPLVAARTIKQEETNKFTVAPRLKVAVAKPVVPIAGDGDDNAERPAFCSLAAASGQCLASLTRYYFDAKSGTCQTFLYGGCGGNGNNFADLQSCQTSCLTLKW